MTNFLRIKTNKKHKNKQQHNEINTDEKKKLY